MELEQIESLLGQVSLTGKQYTGLYGRARLRHAGAGGREETSAPPRKRRNPFRR